MPESKIDRIIISLKQYIKTYSSIAIGVFLFILFFQPFSAIEFDYENRLLFVSGFGAIIFLFMVIIHVVFYETFNEYNEGMDVEPFRFYLLNFILICTSAVSFVFYMRYVGKVGITFNIVVKTVVICTSPAIVLNLSGTIKKVKLKYSALLNENRALQKKCNQFSESYSNKIIEIQSDNDSDNFKVLLADIVYAKSADNYVEIGYLEVGQFRKKLLRNTLKNIEVQLKEYGNFVRTHRTCLVNIQFIEKLNKSYNTYHISLSVSPESIPVSRQYLMVVKELL